MMKPATPRCSVSLNAWSKPALSAASIVLRSQRTRFVPAAGTNERTSSSRRGVQPAGGAVQAAEREPLHLAVDAAALERGLRRARVGELRLSEVDRPERELDDQERHRQAEQDARDVSRRPPSQPERRNQREQGEQCRERERRPESAGQRRLQRGDERVTRVPDVIVRPGARVVERLVQVGHLTLLCRLQGVAQGRGRSAPSSAAARSHRGSPFVPPSSARWPASSSELVRSGATSARASTRPACRAETVIAPLRTRPVSWWSATLVSTGTASPIPSPQKASATATSRFETRGNSASASRPAASSSTPPATACHGRRARPDRACRERRSREGADHEAPTIGSQPPDGDHEQHRKEERADERGEDEPERGVRRQGAVASPPRAPRSGAQPHRRWWRAGQHPRPAPGRRRSRASRRAG